MAKIEPFDATIYLWAKEFDRDLQSVYHKKQNTFTANRSREDDYFRQNQKIAFNDRVAAFSDQSLKLDFDYDFDTEPKNRTKWLAISAIGLIVLGITVAGVLAYNAPQKDPMFYNPADDASKLDYDGPGVEIPCSFKAFEKISEQFSWKEQEQKVFGDTFDTTVNYFKKCDKYDWATKACKKIAKCFTRFEKDVCSTTFDPNASNITKIAREFHNTMSLKYMDGLNATICI